jgi:erythromycin esterase
MIGALDATVELLGFGEALHGGEEILLLRNRLFQRLKVLAFAHNQHLQRGKAEWQLGPHLNVWWPAGAHLGEMLGPRYVVIGSGVGVSAANGIGQPEPATPEALLTRSPEPALLIPTHRLTVAKILDPQ